MWKMTDCAPPCSRLQQQHPRTIAQRPIDALSKTSSKSGGIHADWGIYAKSLDTGEEIAIDADKPMETMSVIKVAILVTAFRQIDAGKLNLKQPITLNLADKRFGTGVLQTLHEGST